MDLQFSCHETLRYWFGPSNPHRMRIGAAQRERSRSNGERFLAPVYSCALHTEWLNRYSATVLPDGAHVRYKGGDGLWWLEKIDASTATDGE